MALVDQFFEWPSSDFGALTTGTLGAGVTNGAGYVFMVPKTGTITTLGFRVNTVTTSGRLNVRLETVDGSGYPSNTAYGGCAAGWVTPRGTGWHSVVLATPASATAGDCVALTIRIDSSANYSVNLCNDYMTRTAYVAADLVGSGWDKQTTAGSPLMFVEYSDGTRPAIVGVQAMTSHSNSALSFHSGSAPDERGNKITMPFTARCIGAQWRGLGPSTADCDLVLYDNASSVLASKSIDADTFKSNTSTEWCHVQWAGVTLTAGSTYRIAMKPTTTNAVVYEMSSGIDQCAQRSQSGGLNVVATSRTDGGAWGDAPQYRYRCMLIFDQLDDGT